MKPLDRLIWMAGLLALVGVAIYWKTIKAAWKNRNLLAAASDAVSQFGG